MSGYCPVGKKSCVCFDTESYNSPVCRFEAVVIFIDQIRRCPLPPPPVAPHAFSIVARDLKTQERIKDARAAGLAEGIRLAREAVEKLVDSHPDINVNAENGWVKLSVILAAIDAVKGE
jgi:hypothetical protein